MKKQIFFFSLILVFVFSGCFESKEKECPVNKDVDITAYFNLPSDRSLYALLKGLSHPDLPYIDIPMIFRESDILKKFNVDTLSDTIYIKSEIYSNTNDICWTRRNLAIWNKSYFVYLTSLAYSGGKVEDPYDLLENWKFSADTLRMIKPRFFELVEKWDTTTLICHQSKRNSRKPAYDLTTVYRIILKDNKPTIDSFNFYEIELDEGLYLGDIPYNELYDGYQRLADRIRVVEK